MVKCGDNENHFQFLIMRTLLVFCENYIFSIRYFEEDILQYLETILDWSTIMWISCSVDYQNRD